jgi:hypothetical protein
LVNKLQLTGIQIAILTIFTKLKWQFLKNIEVLGLLHESAMGEGNMSSRKVWRNFLNDM